MPVVFRRMIELKLIQDAEGSFNIVINLATINFFFFRNAKINIHPFQFIQAKMKRIDIAIE